MRQPAQRDFFPELLQKKRAAQVFQTYASTLPGGKLPPSPKIKEEFVADKGDQYIGMCPNCNELFHLVVSVDGAHMDVRCQHCQSLQKVERPRAI